MKNWWHLITSYVSRGEINEMSYFLARVTEQEEVTFISTESTGTRQAALLILISYVLIFFSQSSYKLMKVEVFNFHFLCHHLLQWGPGSADKLPHFGPGMCSSGGTPGCSNPCQILGRAQDQQNVIHLYGTEVQPVLLGDSDAMVLQKHWLAKKETKLGLVSLGKLQRLVLARMARQ